MSEKSYLRDLHMITKVFREQIQRLELASHTELDSIFSNINDITELTITLIGSLEDTLEMSEDPNEVLEVADASPPQEAADA